MKILWFTSTPSGASKKLISKTASCGWLYSLEKEIKIQPNTELHIAFYYPKKISDFEYEGVYYHPIYDNRYSSKLQNLIGNYREYLFGFKNHDLNQLKAIVNKISPDLIHYHGSELDYGLLQKEITNIPSVLSIQGLLNSCYEKLYSGIPLSVISKYEPLFYKLILKTAQMNDHNFLFSAKREKEIFKLTKNVIGRTDYDRHIAYSMSPHINYFIGNEILRDEFYQNVWDKSSFNETFTIVTTISSGYYKGMEVILRTAHNLKQIGFKFKWIIIGQTEDSYDARIISKWLKLRFSENNVYLVGRKNANEMIDILKSADIYCQAGHIENSPNSVCEAMLLGMPIIASNAGGTNSMLEHKKEGYLIQDGDSFSLAGTIIEVSQNFEMAKVWGISAKKRALKRHNPQSVAKEYLDIYHNIILNKQ